MVDFARPTPPPVIKQLVAWPTYSLLWVTPRAAASRGDLIYAAECVQHGLRLSCGALPPGVPPKWKVELFFMPEDRWRLALGLLLVGVAAPPPLRVMACLAWRVLRTGRTHRHLMGAADA